MAIGTSGNDTILTQQILARLRLLGDVHFKTKEYLAV